MVLVTDRSYAAHIFSSKRPLLLHFPVPFFLINVVFYIYTKV